VITLYSMERDYPYGALRSTNGSKVKVVLAEKGLEFSVQTVRPGDVWKKLPEVLAKHPLGKVPWIDDGDLTLYDSTVINEYLNEKSAANPLLPNDLVQRNKARALENYGDEGVLSKFLPMIWMPWWSPPEQRDEATMQKGRDGLSVEILPFLQQTLGDQPYLCGEFSLADVPMMAMAMVLQVDGMSIDDFPLADAYLQRLRQRPSYRLIDPNTPVDEALSSS
jgi:glutathione S-transferase